MTLPVKWKFYAITIKLYTFLEAGKAQLLGSAYLPLQKYFFPLQKYFSFPSFMEIYGNTEEKKTCSFTLIKHCALRLRCMKLHCRSLHSRTLKQLTEGIPPCLVQSEKQWTSSTQSRAQTMDTGASLPGNHFQVLLTQSCSDLFLWPAAQTIKSKHSRQLAHCSKLRQYINRHSVHSVQNVRHPISSAVHMSERTGTAD